VISWRGQQVAEGESAEVWLSPLVPLVDSEPTTELQRLAMTVDSADTVVHLHRLPTGDDFGLRARGSIGPDGIGVTTADIFDRQGFIGTRRRRCWYNAADHLYAFASI
jgi:hypothetical protein